MHLKGNLQRKLQKSAVGPRNESAPPEPLTKGPLGPQKADFCPPRSEKDPPERGCRGLRGRRGTYKNAVRSSPKANTGYFRGRAPNKRSLGTAKAGFCPPRSEKDPPERGCRGLRGRRGTYKNAVRSSPKANTGYFRGRAPNKRSLGTAKSGLLPAAQRKRSP